MDYSQPLDQIPLWVLFSVTVILFIIAAESGFRVGKFVISRSKQARKSQVGTILGASLGLLAFLLAITFSMAGSRFDTRKQLVLGRSECNRNHLSTCEIASRTFSLRISGFTSQICKCSSGNSDRYIGHNPTNNCKIGRITKPPLVQTIDLTEKEPISIVTGLFIKSLNEALDLHGKRVTAGLLNRISSSVIMTLYFVAFLCMATMGYQAGLTGVRTLVSGFGADTCIFSCPDADHRP